MPSIVLRGISYRTPEGDLLFDDLSATIGAERLGLVGRNGVGKSTLGAIIAGDLPPTAGSVEVTGRLRCLRQDVDGGGMNVADAFGVMEDLAVLHRSLDGAGDADDLARADWTLDDRLAAALAETGLPGIDLERPLSSLSGGERTRVHLAALTFDDPDVILLDEPTNNLDAEGRALVGHLLSHFTGAALVISHDRELLRMMDRIAELSMLGLKIYGGGFDFYAGRRAAERETAAVALEDAKRDVKVTERKIREARERQDRRDASGRRSRKRGDAPKILLDARKQRAEATASRGTGLADRQRSEAAGRLAEAEAGVERVTTMAAMLPSTHLPASRSVLALEDVTAGYAGRPPVIANFTFRLDGPMRVAVVGPNGSGKTTLLKLLTGDMAPSSGAVRLHVNAAMLDQSVALLDPASSILENHRRLNPRDDDNAARSALARFKFRAGDALKTVSTLSGGERLRAGLATVLGADEPPQLLILDEPTNHLDLDSIAAIEAGLADYDGALLVVSHDRDFLDALGVSHRIDFGAVSGDRKPAVLEGL